jgi:TetR/AcrR family transcriptional repressor of lmrAB and yxaGH operons
MTIIIIKYDDCHSQKIFMSQHSKDEMIEGALLLLAKHGLQATSFSEVLALTKAPRGSIYHHFPGGKKELVSAALQLSERRTTAAITALAEKAPEDITKGFLELWRRLLIYSDFTAGCSAVAVTVATDSPELLNRATAIFRSWRMALTSLFIGAGLPEELALEFAVMLIASSEGAVVMSRAEKSIEPFEQVAKQLVQQAARYGVSSR